MGIYEDFVDGIVEENLLCAICQGVLDKPILACQEGHSYCECEFSENVCVCARVILYIYNTKEFMLSGYIRQLIGQPRL